jgi:hypothetical protein
VSDWTLTLPVFVSLPVRFLPLTVHVTVPSRLTVASGGSEIVFQILIKLPIIAPFNVAQIITQEFEKI